VERTLVEPLEERLRQVGQKPGKADHRQVNEEAHGSAHDDGTFKP
jgi:hypothetical protein